MRTLIAVCMFSAILALSGYAQEGSMLIPLPHLNSTAADVSPDISGDGRFIVFQSSRAGGRGAEDIYLYDRQSENFVLLPGLNSSGPDFAPTLSANGRYIAFASVRPGGAGRSDVYLYDLGGKALVELPGLNSALHEDHPVISADGRMILYRARPDLRLYDRQAQALVPLPGVNAPGVVQEFGELSDDARFVAFFRERGLQFLGDFLFDRQTGQLQRHDLRVTDLGADARLMVILEFLSGGPDLYLYDREAGRRISLPGLNSPTVDNSGRLSQNGRFIVFTSYRNGFMNPDIFLYQLAP